MVVFTPAYPPQIVNAYSTVRLLPEVHNAIIHDYNIGSFARFHRPETVISIHDRADFHGLSHLDIRLLLDQENKKEGFAIIDATTAESHAVWWVATTDECQFHAEEYTGMGYPPITYPGEALTLYHLHVMTQALPLEYLELTGGDDDIAWEILEGELARYDPHAPQEPPFDSTRNFTRKEDVDAFIPSVLIIASPGEWEWSDVARPLQEFPPGAVRLTAEAAKEAGLVPSWVSLYPFGRKKPQAGQTVEMQQPFDWDSPKWPWDGVVLGGNKTNVATAKRDRGLRGIRCQGAWPCAAA
ncbi:MAG: hypothetical protein Q9191_006490 [Dirinaria sp. TL-2023a]